MSKKRNRTFSFYKEEVSLVDYILQEFPYNPSTKTGWKIGKRSTARSPRLEEYRGGNKVDIITIKKKKGENLQMYWSQYNNDGHYKSILDFVVDHNDLHDNPRSLMEAAKILDNYVDSDRFINVRDSQFKPIHSTRTNLNDKQKLERNSLEDLTDYKYLKSRGITEETINNPIFKGQIKQQSFSNQKGDRKWNNTVFIMRNQEGIGCLSYKNRTIFKKNGKTEKKGFKGFSGEVGRTAFVTNRPEGNLDQLVVVEAAEDAMAYYQMNVGDCQDKNVQFFSFEGNPGHEQISLLQSMVNGPNAPKELVFAMDNDMFGYKHTATILSGLYIAENKSFPEEKIINDKSLLIHSEHFNIRPVGDKGKKVSNANFQVLSRSGQSADLIQDRLTNSFDKINKMLKEEYAMDKPLTYSFSTNESNNVTVSLKFDSKVEIWQKVTDMIKEEKFNNHPMLKQEVSYNKDFGEDLEEELSIGKFAPPTQEEVQEIRQNINQNNQNSLTR